MYSILKAVIIFIWVSIFSYSSIFADFTVNESLQSIKVKINGLNPTISNIDTLNVLAPNNSIFPTTPFNKSSESLSFRIAIDNSLPNVQYKVLSEKTISEFENLDISKIPNIYSISISEISRSRNLNSTNINFQPFRYDSKSNLIYYADSVEIIVELNNSISLGNEQVGFKDDVFFADVINKKHLNTLLSERKNLNIKDNSLEFQSKNWYNNNLDYARIETTNDKIVKLKLSDVIKVLPNIIGKNSANLHLIHKGSPYPYLILYDDGIISDNDEIIFYGQRPSGDTTWFDNYTSYEPFYITYDESSTAMRFDVMNVSKDNQLNFFHNINISNHYEVESFYGIGSEFVSNFYDGSVRKSFFYDTRTIMGEGWFWDVIAPKEYTQNKFKSKFTYHILLDPSDSNDDKLNISLWYRTNQDSIARQNLPVVSTYFDLRLHLNGNQKSRDSLLGYNYKSISHNASPDELLNGFNGIELESKQIFIETNERTNIDFIKIEGRIKPYAIDDEINITGENQNFIFKPSGFSSNHILALDIVNNTYTDIMYDKRGTMFRVSGTLENKITATLGINQSHTLVGDEGIHVYSLNNTNKSEEYRKFAINDNSVNSYLNSLSDGTSIAILILSKSSNINDLSAISALGSKLISNYQAGAVYVGAFVKGIGLAKENLAQVRASFSEFFEHENGLNHNFDLALESQNNSIFTISGLASLPVIDRIFRVDKSELRKTSNLDVVFISHSDFIVEAERLAEYRRNTLGMSIEVINVDEIYKEFNYGKIGPHAIKDYLKYTYDNRNLSYVLLIGDATWDPRKLLQNSISNNFIPTYGFPVSDWWFACLDGEDDVRPELILGRLPVNTTEQAKNYIDKVIEYENLAEAPWMKNILFLVGGYDKREINIFGNLLYTHYLDNILNPSFCGTFSTVIKDVDGPSTSFQGGLIREQINKGALWTIYIGHAAAEIFDLDGWNVSSLNNKGRYGLLTTISCNTGAFAEPQLIASRNEQYILEKDKGYVTATGGSYSGFLQPHNTISSRMIDALADTSKKMRFIGDLLIYGKSNLASIYFDQLSTLHTFALLGDPLVRVRVGDMPDAFLTETNLTILNEKGLDRFTDKDEFVKINGNVFNYGYSFNQDLILRIIKDYNHNSDTLVTTFKQLCYSDKFEFIFNINNLPGRHRFTIEVDPDNLVTELSKLNNKLVLNIDVFKEGILNFDPMENWDVSSVNPKFRVVNPLHENGNFDYHFLITTSPDTLNILHSSFSNLQNDDIIISENYIDWNPDFSLVPKSYWLHTRYVNNTDNTWSTWTSIPFNSNANFQSKSVRASLSSFDEFVFGQVNDLMINKELDNSVKISMRRDTLKFNALGLKGNLPDNPEGNPVVVAHVNMEAGDVVFVDGPHDIGFNVATIKSSNGSVISRYKRFETWGLETPYPAEENFQDNNISRELVSFLRDSVADDEYVLIATCKSSFRIPYLYKMYGDEGDYGSIDSLLYYLSSFGSKIADTLIFDENFNGEQVSFSMMGWRGAEIGSIPEAISFVGDTAWVKGELITFSNDGSFKPSFISKAKKWNNLNIDGFYPDNGTEVNLRLLGLNNNSGSIDTLLEVINPKNVDLSGINSKIYSEISPELHFYQSKYDIQSLLSNPETFVKSITVNFEPADELAIIKSKTVFDDESLLRGDKLKLFTEIENMSLRSSLDTATLRINVSRSGSDNDFRNISISSINPNNSIEIEHEIVTDFLDYSNLVSLSIDPNENLNEFFRFNNQLSKALNINKDTIKPSIVLKIDDKFHQYGDFISILPLIEVELWDNSPLAIKDSNFITVRVNGFLHPYQRTKWSEFVPINDGTNLRAIFRFIPDTLQYEDASIIVYFRDNEGNADTLNTLARLSLINATIEDVYTYPNPSNDLVKFNIVFKAPNHGTEANLEIFDLSGNLIYDAMHNLRLGKNTFEWNGYHKQGSSVPSGIYIYRIRFKSDFFIEPAYGKFMIIR